MHAVQRGLHQIAHPNGCIGPAQQGGVVGLGLLRQADPLVAVDGGIDQHSGLDFGVAFLHQTHLAGHGGHAVDGGQIHGRSPRALAVHVVAEGPLIAQIKGLQVDDGAGMWTLACGVNREVWIALCPDASRDRLPLGHGHVGTEADSLDAFEAAVLVVESVVVIAEILPIHLLGGVKQASHTADRVDGFAQLHLDGFGHVPHQGRLNALMGLLVKASALLAEAGGDRQTHQEHQ